MYTHPGLFECQIAGGFVRRCHGDRVMSVPRSDDVDLVSSPGLVEREVVLLVAHVGVEVVDDVSYPHEAGVFVARIMSSAKTA